MVKKVIILVSITILFLPNFGRTCDCIPTSEKFLDNLSKRQLVIHIKVVEHVQYDSEGPNPTGFGGITKMIVIKSFKGKLWTDTLIHINTSPSLCGSSIQHLKVNQEAFLKASLTRELHTYDFSFEPIEANHNITNLIRISQQYQNISTANCDVAILPITDGIAEGRITKKLSFVWKMYSLINGINKNWGTLYFDKFILNKNTMEKKKVINVYYLINQKIEAYR